MIASSREEEKWWSLLLLFLLFNWYRQGFKLQQEATDGEGKGAGLRLCSLGGFPTAPCTWPKGSNMASVERMKYVAVSMVVHAKTVERADEEV